jgi:hypothetical protein
MKLYSNVLLSTDIQQCAVLKTVVPERQTALGLFGLHALHVFFPHRSKYSLSTKRDVTLRIYTHKQRLQSSQPFAKSSKTTMDDFPSACCPITQEFMTDPVFATDNHTYERNAILHWWAKCDERWADRTSPMTGTLYICFFRIPMHII